MKTDIHPKYFDNASVTCACGAKYTVGSTMEKIEVEICAACHPFFTGQEKVMDMAGRVDKFKKRAVKATTTVSRKKVAKIEAVKVRAAAKVEKAKKAPKLDKAAASK